MLYKKFWQYWILSRWWWCSISLLYTLLRWKSSDTLVSQGTLYGFLYLLLIDFVIIFESIFSFWNILYSWTSSLQAFWYVTLLICILFNIHKKMHTNRLVGFVLQWSLWMYILLLKDKEPFTMQTKKLLCRIFTSKSIILSVSIRFNSLNCNEHK